MPAISHQLAAYFSLEIYPVFTNEMRNICRRTQTLVEKPQSCLNSELLSLFNHQKPNTLLSSLAFPQNHGVWVPKQPNSCSNFHAFFGAHFFFLCLHQSFCHLLKTLLKTLQLGTQTRILEVFRRWPQPEFSFVCDAGYVTPGQCSDLLSWGANWQMVIKAVNASLQSC